MFLMSYEVASKAGEYISAESLEQAADFARERNSIDNAFKSVMELMSDGSLRNIIIL